MKSSVQTFDNINRFSMNISYIDIDAESKLNVNDPHIHDECEIYINLSGDVIFSVENSLYPIMPGNIIITRPFEYHNCIYKSNTLHEHYWILFNPNGNEALFDVFYNRKLGENNLLILDSDKTDELINACEGLNSEGISETEKYFYFFSLIKLLNTANAFNAPNNFGSKDVITAINYINSHLTDSLSVAELSEKCFVSISTLERHFLQMFNISPSEYIKKKRLANAAKLLSEGRSVTDAAALSGFSDCSKFIASFKKLYNTTPLKYKNNFKNNRPSAANKVPKP